MKGQAVIAGAAMTRFARHRERAVGDLALEAARGALADAGIGAHDVDMALFANAAWGVMAGQEMIRGQAALRSLDLDGAAIANVENACASSSTAVLLAGALVSSGQAGTVLVVGAEQLTSPDKVRTMAAFSVGVDLAEHPRLRAEAEAYLLGMPGSRVDGPPAHSAMMDLYAAKTARYLDATAATPADVAGVAVKNRRHAASNPRAQYRDPITVDDVLGSRMIADPLRLLMCAPVGDGAAALVVTSPARAARLGGTPVTIAGSALRSGRDRADDQPSVVTRAALAAYEAAGRGPEDVDVVELHDAAASAELMLYEELGLCASGEGAALLASGATALGGRVPVNPSGGLLSKGHPIAATGAAQLVELVDQLRGRAGDRQVPGARVALAQNAGGMLGPEEASAVVTVLTR